MTRKRRRPPRRRDLAALAPALLCVALPCTLVGAPEARADRLITTEGEVHEGTIRSESATSVFLETEAGPLVLPRSRIREIEHEGGSAAPGGGDGAAAQGGGFALERTRSRALHSVPQAPRVTLAAAGEEASAVAGRLSEAVGYPVVLYDAEDASRPVTLDLGGVPAWEAIVALCRELGIRRINVRYFGKGEGHGLWLGEWMAGFERRQDPTFFLDGPVLLSYLGPVTSTFTGDDRDELTHPGQTRYQVQLIPDLEADLKVLEPSEQVFELLLADGSRERVKAGDATVQTGGGVIWSFFLPEGQPAPSSVEGKVTVRIAKRRVRKDLPARVEQDVPLGGGIRMRLFTLEKDADSGEIEYGFAMGFEAFQQPRAPRRWALSRFTLVDRAGREHPMPRSTLVGADRPDMPYSTMGSFKRSEPWPVSRLRVDFHTAYTDERIRFRLAAP